MISSSCTWKIIYPAIVAYKYCSLYLIEICISTASATYDRTSKLRNKNDRHILIFHEETAYVIELENA